MAPEPPESEPLRVVLVDDSSIFLGAARRTLEKHPGFRVVGAVTSAEAGLAQVEALRPGLVIMDLVMPGMNGLEATRRIKALEGALRVVVLTLYDHPGLRENARIAGADGFLSKRCWVEELWALVVGWATEDQVGAAGRDPAGKKGILGAGPGD